MLLDCECRHLKEILMKLKIYKLRSEVNLRDVVTTIKFLSALGKNSELLICLKGLVSRSYRGGYVMVDHDMNLWACNYSTVGSWCRTISQTWLCGILSKNENRSWDTRCNL